MIYKTKKVLLRFCSKCPYLRYISMFERTEFIGKTPRCKNILLSKEHEHKNPLGFIGNVYGHFPDWCPLTDGEDIEI